MINREELRKSLVSLAEVLNAAEAVSYKASFEEFLCQHEFGLALHSVCDYLVLENPSLITVDRLLLVQELHGKMHLEDDCVRELEAARAKADHIARNRA